MLLTTTRPASFTATAATTRPAAPTQAGATTAVKRFFKTLLRALAAPTA